jgi:radical SAM protein with 4Fe4S-binding SPASM domain
MDQRTLPSRLYIDVTNSCNLSCLHCCSSSGHKKTDELTDQEIVRIIDEAAGSGITNLIFSGGEPLLRESLPDLIEHAVRAGCGVTLLTNGLLFTSELAGRLIAPKVRIKMSLDGTTAQTHEALRGPGTFKRTLDVLGMLVDLGAPGLTVHFTVNRWNFRELRDLPSLLKEIGVSFLVVGTIKPSGRAAVNRELLIPPVMIPYVNRVVTEITDKAEIPTVRFTDRGWGEFGCPAVCSKMGLTADGRLNTCVFFGDALQGDSVRDFSLPELWNRHIELMKDLTPGKTCSKCGHLKDCAGGCRARALYYTGDVRGPDPYSCALYGKMTFIRENKELLESLKTL